MMVHCGIMLTEKIATPAFGPGLDGVFCSAPALLLSARATSDPHNRVSDEGVTQIVGSCRRSDNDGLSSFHVCIRIPSYGTTRSQPRVLPSIEWLHTFDGHDVL